MITGADAQVATSANATAPAEDPALVDLLDHIAVELAQEYVQLMEAAAETEATAPRPHSDTGLDMQ